MAGTSTKKVRKPSKRSKPSPLPSQYGFTPRTTEPPPHGNRGAGPTVSDYPPPRQLFEESTPRTQPRADSTPLSQPAPPPKKRDNISCSVDNELFLLVNCFCIPFFNDTFYYILFDLIDISVYFLCFLVHCHRQKGRHYGIGSLESTIVNGKLWRL
uniref:Uncharacterized protein n=1 Tax=Brassica oleracea TaxID=3712 RepID=A0A3P6F4K8_BRAOL|nr:unnamed protein product [Brassica oleracea]